MKLFDRFFEELKKNVSPKYVNRILIRRLLLSLLR